MKSTDLGPQSEIEPGSRLTYINSEKVEYKHAINISLNFARWNKESMFLDLRDAITFTEMESATDVIRHLRGLADRLEKNCVDFVEEKK